MPDFRLEDVWALPAQGGAGDFGKLLEVMAELDPEKGASGPTRWLFRLRWQLGRWFGWDRDDKRKLAIPDDTATTLSARLPEDLRHTATDVAPGSGRFTALYQTDDEWAAEISNGTVHAVMHLAWVDRGNGGYRGQMGVYVKPRGRLGGFYMALIKPFRHLVVYPALMRQIEQAWNEKKSG